MIGNTVLQVGSLTPTDWVTISSNVIVTIATVVLAIYAYFTIQEMRSDRRQHSLEKQLEELYNPMYEILQRGEPHEAYSAKHQRNLYYRSLPRTDVCRLREMLERCGHYLDDVELQMMRKLLSIEITLGDKYLIFPDEGDLGKELGLTDLHPPVHLAFTYTTCLAEVEWERNQRRNGLLNLVRERRLRRLFSRR